MKLACRLGFALHLFLLSAWCYDRPPKAYTSPMDVISTRAPIPGLDTTFNFVEVAQEWTAAENVTSDIQVPQILTTLSNCSNATHQWQVPVGSLELH